jgi:hypothetical protein
MGRGAVGPVSGRRRPVLGPRRASRSVKLTIDGDTLELTNASADDQRWLVESFVARPEAASP